MNSACPGGFELNAAHIGGGSITNLTIYLCSVFRLLLFNASVCLEHTSLICFTKRIEPRRPVSNVCYWQEAVKVLVQR